MLPNRSREGSKEFGKPVQAAGTKCSIHIHPLCIWLKEMDRRKKVRCSGERPACSFCERLNQECHYLEENSWMSGEGAMHRGSFSCTSNVSKSPAGSGKAHMLTSGPPEGGPFDSSQLSGSQSVAAQQFELVSARTVIRLSFPISAEVTAASSCIPNLINALVQQNGRVESEFIGGPVSSASNPKTPSIAGSTHPSLRQSYEF